MTDSRALDPQTWSIFIGVRSLTRDSPISNSLCGQFIVTTPIPDDHRSVKDLFVGRKKKSWRRMVATIYDKGCHKAIHQNTRRDISVKENSFQSYQLGHWA
ncbi:hypothetical protein AVEN_96061-1 [Araneus ventricosus]|uniref:Uncharacterized protein n=1 Tax=Araneus ventricosus TaxID=182803 RepID=A0A4Y2B3A2_ARAVE|nr:hypothetical protein AVEN_96061-1 [Araneus ventricosus]